jgi:transaldolase
MNPIEKLQELGQSIWLDYIRRDLLRSGELARMVSEGTVRGVTSNPTIFEQAISQGDLYAETMRPMVQRDWSPEQIFDALAINDIREATDILLPVYEATNGADGFVSIEVSPELANDGETTLKEARRLWDALNRPNVMIKIPATLAGVPAIEQAILEGINVNVTLIFSLQRYAEVIDAYQRGLEQRLARGESLDHVASVASFFVSRVDSKVDALLEELMSLGSAKPARADALRGKIAIANAKLAYAQYKGAFGGDRFGTLQQRGARVQRPLWASTSTKNPAYPDTYYVDNLIACGRQGTNRGAGLNWDLHARCDR